MFSKSIIVIAFVAIAKLATATPPACLLAAINTADDPSKVSDICQSSKMENTIVSYCGSNTQQALSDYALVCKGAGVTVSSVAPSSATGSAAASSSGSATANASKNTSIALSASKPVTSVIVYTTASFDSSCSCTKTAAVTSTAIVAPTALVTSGTATGTAAAATSTGGAGSLTVGGGFAAVVAVVGGLFAVL
ncbi:hypothetical protein K432DRAFT_381580 [Lepidopterella palustris CBS 459.81]|uniref:GPI anchored cell wall protein n=1 Tax=Lepidopterella palustris CBS 459.81 TaxID=1314670 RepID=A0A8E2EBZ3_9PEZI|nr:hypothetical protein K432DRAFT_381580 [Lepidopterella palustris CBS 459.81]